MAHYPLIRAAMTAWDFEQEPLSMGVEDGIAWALTRGGFFGMNGYVLVPAEGHIFSKFLPPHDILDTILTVHGGITYAEHPWIGFDTAHAFDRWPDTEFDAPWIGFDTAHAFDRWPDTEFDAPPSLRPSRTTFNYPQISWTRELMIDETRSLARQLTKCNGFNFGDPRRSPK